MNNIILYQNTKGKVRVQVRFENETFWLTQKAMAELFQTTKSTISEHLSNIFLTGELNEESTVRNFRTVQKEGTREVTRDINFYNLDAVIAVGYRVNSKQATQFRIWATQTLKEFIIKGFVLDDERLLYAVTKHTAAEIIVERANANFLNMGLTSWKGSRVRKEDIFIAKNYLTKDEIDTLNRMVNLFLDTAELRVKEQSLLSMDFWKNETDKVIEFSNKPILSSSGNISHEQMKIKAEKEFVQFDSQRKILEAEQSDKEENEAIEKLIKKTKKKL